MPLLVLFLIAGGLLLAGWLRTSVDKQPAKSVMFGLAFQAVVLSVVVVLLETKRKGGEAFWRHSVGATLVSTANVLNSKSNAKKVQDLIFESVNGGMISFAQLQELLRAMRALELSSNSKTNLVVSPLSE